MKKILIIRFSSIGDIVLTTPVIRAIKTQLEDSEVHYCTKEPFLPILQENPYIDKIHLLGDSLKNLVGKLKNEQFDFIIDLHHNLRTFRIKNALRIPSRSFNKLNLEKWLLVNLKMNRMPNVHIVDRYLDTAKALGVKPDKLGLDYFIPDADTVERDWLPASHRSGYIVFAIGGQHATKKLPVNKMIELCDRINKPVVLIGGKEDEIVGNQIEEFFKKPNEESGLEEGLKKLGKKTTIFNGCGKFSINQSASVIKGAKVVFTHDTGMMHIAAAFKKQVFSIWGNTVPIFGMYPYQTKFTIFENNQLDCRPCSKIGFDKCPKGHFKCMKDIVFDFYIPD